MLVTSVQELTRAKITISGSGLEPNQKRDRRVGMIHNPLVEIRGQYGCGLNYRRDSQRPFEFPCSSLTKKFLLAFKRSCGGHMTDVLFQTSKSLPSIINKTYDSTSSRAYLVLTRKKDQRAHRLYFIYTLIEEYFICLE